MTLDEFMAWVCQETELSVSIRVRYFPAIPETPQSVLAEISDGVFSDSSMPGELYLVAGYANSITEALLDLCDRLNILMSHQNLVIVDTCPTDNIARTVRFPDGSCALRHVKRVPHAHIDPPRAAADHEIIFGVRGGEIVGR